MFGVRLYAPLGRLPRRLPCARRYRRRRYRFQHARSRSLSTITPWQMIIWNKSSTKNGARSSKFPPNTVTGESIDCTAWSGSVVELLFKPRVTYAWVKIERNCSHLAMQVGGLHAYREQYFEEAVECLGTRQIMPSPSTEKSHGIAPDYRCASALVRWRRILGSQSRSLVINRLFRVL